MSAKKARNRVRWTRRVLFLTVCVDLFGAGVNVARDRPGWVVFYLAVACFVSLTWWHMEYRVKRLRAETTALLVAAAEFAPRPQGVRIVRANGEEVPVELVYLGFDEGHYEWLVAGAVLNADDRLTVDVWPGHTGLIIASGDGTGGWQMRP